MFIADTLIVVGLATASLGTVAELGGEREHSFWLRNDGTEAVTLRQGYTSCECTGIDFDLGATVDPGDSTLVTLRFNPAGRGGEFTATGTVVYGNERKRAKMTLTGTVAMSEQTLMRRFPVAVSRSLRLSTNQFDLGVMHPGQSAQRNVMVLHRDENDSTEMLTVDFTVAGNTPKGVRHINYPLTTHDNGVPRQVNITLDVLVK